MDPRALDDIQRRLTRLEGGLSLRYGLVDTTSPLAVKLGGGDVAQSCRSLVPVKAGDQVAVASLRGDLLIVGVPDSDNPLVPAARVYNSANISHATSGSWQALTFNSERYDNDSIHSTSSDTQKLVCRSPGVYAITGHVLFDANATGVRGIEIRVSGTSIAQQLQTAISASFWYPLSIGTQYKLAVDDYVELRVYQNSGGALNLLASSNISPEFSMTKVSDG